MAGRTLWLALATAVPVFVGASSPWTAQRAPRFLFPGLAAAGAVVIALSFVRSLVRSVARYRAERRVRVLPVLVNAVVAMMLVVVPLTHLLRAMTASGDGTPRILAGFADWLGAEGYPRPSPHRGIDVAGRIGADVLAALRPGESVERGQRIGAVGTSGQRAWPAFEHVHLELQRGRDRRDIEDPLPKIVGCFDRAKPYPTDRLVLTYPVKC